ncbi:hypothetical protein AMATHDRAFT_142848 [Amanita thiersii Skay4041]|uniref:Uncharacterized protein n=1 Tax=Amanita thiersii Skay4041 TaxID=703135 RepID=A0A2A9NL94_9AGAR|nr:hypothetical protein AMATHDRAFT_142848 [Amanita thiersii Skay4041]
MSRTEIPAAGRLKAWLLNHGGEYHRQAIMVQASNGSSVVANEELPENTRVASCPFSLIITAGLAQRALSHFIDTQAIFDNDNWTERQWISTYICFHWIISEEKEESQYLLHYAYINTLPSNDQLLTPLHFTPSELKAFKGTNLYSAALQRECEWREEFMRCLNAVQRASMTWCTGFTWDRYLAAATYLSSRCFPSSLLSRTPSLQPTASTEPVLIPGLDSLNHARGAAVTWVVAYPDPADPDPSIQSQTEPLISLVLRSTTSPGQELLNNYGLKPNSELILGYGFTLHNNPDDTIAIKVGGISDRRWEIGRSARGLGDLWNEILRTFAPEAETVPSYEDQLDAVGFLTEMSQVLLDQLPPMQIDEGEEVRPEVMSMLTDYVEGQRDILESIINYANQQEQEIIVAARADGVEFVFED